MKETGISLDGVTAQLVKVRGGGLTCEQEAEEPARETDDDGKVIAEDVDRAGDWSSSSWSQGIKMPEDMDEAGIWWAGAKAGRWWCLRNADLMIISGEWVDEELLRSNTEMAADGAERNIFKMWHLWDDWSMETNGVITFGNGICFIKHRHNSSCLNVTIFNVLILVFLLVPNAECGLSRYKFILYNVPNVLNCNSPVLI